MKRNTIIDSINVIVWAVVIFGLAVLIVGWTR